MAFTQVYLALMKSTGRSGSSTAYAAAAMLTNIVLNYIFIYGKFGAPAMGIRGAALSAVLSRLLELAAVIAENCRMENIRFRFRYFIRLKEPLRKGYLAVAAPSVLSVFEWGMFHTNSR